eukprot:3025832-Amphidinium_carterae.1
MAESKMDKRVRQALACPWVRGLELRKPPPGTNPHGFGGLSQAGFFAKLERHLQSWKHCFPWGISTRRFVANAAKWGEDFTASAGPALDVTRAIIREEKNT